MCAHSRRWRCEAETVADFYSVLGEEKFAFLNSKTQIIPSKIQTYPEVFAKSVRYKAKLIDFLNEIVDHVFGGLRHLRCKQTFDRKVGIPVVSLFGKEKRYPECWFNRLKAAYLSKTTTFEGTNEDGKTKKLEFRLRKTWWIRAYLAQQTDAWPESEC